MLHATHQNILKDIHAICSFIVWSCWSNAKQNHSISTQAKTFHDIYHIKYVVCSVDYMPCSASLFPKPQHSFEQSLCALNIYHKPLQNVLMNRYKFYSCHSARLLRLQYCYFYAHSLHSFHIPIFSDTNLYFDWNF